MKCNFNERHLKISTHVILYLIRLKLILLIASAIRGAGMLVGRVVVLHITGRETQWPERRPLRLRPLRYMK